MRVIWQAVASMYPVQKEEPPGEMSFSAPMFQLKLEEVR